MSSSTEPAVSRLPVLLAAGDGTRDGAVSSAGRRNPLVSLGRWLGQSVPLTAVLAVAGFLRFWQLDRIGFNGDEAVYSGTAASIAGDQTLRTMFPIFRAHPLLSQVVLSTSMHGQVSDWTPRAVMAVAGVLTVAVTYLVGKRLYGRLAGLIAAAVLAVMPYHVVVSRQVLLDGFMTLFATLTVYCVVLYIETAALRWMLATSAVMGLAVLSKETSIVLVGGLYAFFALTPAVRLHLRHVLLGLIMMAAVITAFPMTVSLSGRASTGGQYLLWQLFRRPNHGPLFYAQVVPPALGWLALGAAGLGLVMLRRESTWRERLLLTWVAVPLAFFCLWPVKGYQYLLPIAPIVAILAGRAIARIATVPALVSHRRQSAALVASLSVVLIASLIVPTWSHINPSPSGTFLSGTGGVPGAREAGLWVNHNVPSDAQLLAIGPSMANILEFYGKRRVYALSVSPEPANRNPAYVPVPNPDLALRQGRFQYLVWDSYTATRSPSFGDKITALVQRYQGVAVFTSTVNVRSTAGRTVAAAVVVVYQVRPS